VQFALSSPVPSQAVWLEGWTLRRAVLGVQKVGALRDSVTQAASCRVIVDSYALAGKVIGACTDGAADERML
jgi:hypothetical protein